MPPSRALRLYNSLTRSVETLESKRDFFGFYCCGPTVYGRAHIGNFRTFVCTDLLVRVLRAFGYPLKFVMNLTDVDDKTIRGARQAGQRLQDFTREHAKSFHRDREALSITPPDIEPRATGHIHEMIALIEKLVSGGHAYVAEDGSVYYRIDSFPAYGCLCRLDRDGLRAGARVEHDEYEKESLSDFVLWKKHRPEDGDVFWESPWGRGRPGWHLECSAMSMKYLGESYELHGGGVDLLFPHHENEIAQSEAATGRPFVQHWWHVAHLQVDGRKMSKSLGNLHTLEDIVNKGHTARELRYALICGNYRDPFNFTWEGMTAAREALARLDSFSARLHDALSGREAGEADAGAAALEQNFFDVLAEDLNISAALGELFMAVRRGNAAIDDGAIGSIAAPIWIKALKRIDAVLGVGLGEPPSTDLPADVRELVRRRDEARRNKQWADSDRFRDELVSRGYVVQDGPAGTQVARKR